MLRLIDANMDRLREGLRVLEDVARFILNSADLTQRLKSLRHELASGDSVVQERLLLSRSVGEDVGAKRHAPGEMERSDLAALVMANARRVQEALRVLEEAAKLPEAKGGLDAGRLERARFAVYEMEQRLVALLKRQERQRRVRGLYVIIDPAVCGRKSSLEVARQALSGGVQVLQLRDKRPEKRSALSLAWELKALCTEASALFLVNDYLDMALAVDADGLHLGQQDLPLEVARRLLPPDRIVGISTHNLEEAQQAEAQGADYIALGSIFETPTKADFHLAGLETLRQVKQSVSIPVVAIGGINRENIGQVAEAGADAVAVISAIALAPDVAEETRRLVSSLEVKSP